MYYPYCGMPKGTTQKWVLAKKKSGLYFSNVQECFKPSSEALVYYPKTGGGVKLLRLIKQGVFVQSIGGAPLVYYPVSGVYKSMICRY